MTQKQLGKAVGVHGQTINKIERGEIEWSRRFLDIERVLGMPYGTLIANGNRRAVAELAEADALDVFVCRLANDHLIIGSTPFEKMSRRIEAAYAIRCTNDMWSPLFEARDLILVTGELPQAGRFAFIRGNDEGVPVGWFGKVVKIESKKITLQSGFESGTRQSFSKDNFPLWHRVVGKLSR